MNKLDIFCFTSVARTKSFSLTARELRISQQAVSKHIRNMENELGHQLFFRDCTPVELTKAGAFMLEYFTLRGDIIEEINSDIEKKNPVVSLNIGFSQWSGSPGWFLEKIRTYRELYPDLKVFLQNLDSKELLSAASDRKVDLLIASRYMSRYLPSTWKCIRVSEQPLYIIRSKHFSYLSGQDSLYPFYAPEAGESNTDAVRIRVRAICSLLGFMPQTIIPCHDMGTVLLNVLLNGGITIGTHPPDRGNGDDYSFEQTALFSDLMLCLPWQTEQTAVNDFVSYITSRTEGGPA